MGQARLLVARHLAHVESSDVGAAAGLAHLRGVFASGVPGLHVLPEYVPSAAWHILAELNRIVLEHARAGAPAGPPWPWS